MSGQTTATAAAGGLLGRCKARLRARRGSLDGKALQLLLGTMLGQGLVFLVSPLLTRLFTPQEFGVLGAYTAALTIVGSLATLRYEFAFATVRSDREAFDLLVLCGGCIAATTLLACAAAALLHRADALGALGPYWLALPIGLACVGGYNVLAAEAVRLGRYGVLATTRIWQGLVSAAMQVGAGLLALGPAGLLAGYVAGQSGGMLSIWRSLRATHRRRPDLRASFGVATRYRALPAYSSWSGVLDAAGNGHLLTLMMGALYGVEIAGYIFLAERVIARPLMMTANSLLSVYVGEVARLRHADAPAIRRVFRSVLMRQSAISLAWIATVACALPFVLVPLFGAGWAGGVVPLQLMALACLAPAIMQSVGNTLPTLGRPGLAAAWSVVRLPVVALAIYLPYRWGFGLYASLVAYAGAQCLTQGSLFLLMRRTIHALR